MSGGRAVVATLAVWAAVTATATWLLTLASPLDPGEDAVVYLVNNVVLFGTLWLALGVPASVVAWWAARHAVGRDRPERLLALATTSLPAARAVWGRAMRAELASIEAPAERRAFARSAARAAVVSGIGRPSLLLAAAVAALTAPIVYAASRLAYANGRHGIVAEPLLGLPALLLVLAVLVGTLLGRSFRAGLTTAVLAWLASWAATVAVEVPEGLRWYRDAHVYLLDGDAIGITELNAAFEPVYYWPFLMGHAVTLGFAVLAAAFGAFMLRLVRRGRDLAAARRAGVPSAARARVGARFPDATDHSLSVVQPGGC